MALDDAQLDGLVAEAAAILDDAAKPFMAGHRAESAVAKLGNDFATEVDPLPVRASASAASQLRRGRAHFLPLSGGGESGSTNCD